MWGDDKYELANFTDDELVPALTELAVARGNPLVGAGDWEAELRARLQEARRKHDDIKVPIGLMRMREDKVALADALWPVLLAKCEREMATGEIETPVLECVLHVRQIVSRLSGSGYALQRV